MANLESERYLALQEKNRKIDEHNLQVVENNSKCRYSEYHMGYIPPYSPPKHIVLPAQAKPLDLSMIEPVYLDFVVDGNKFFIDEVVITLSKYPLCFETGDLDSYCETCDFFSKTDCLFQSSNDLFSSMLYFYKSAWKRARSFKSYKSDVIDALHRQLSLTKGPVHYQDLTLQVRKKYPNLNVKPRSAYRLMHENPDKFKCYRAGWYIAV